jgi:hypothetical protein
MSSSISRLDRFPSATAVHVKGEWLRVELRDGRTLSVPISWFDWLARANDVERDQFEIIEDGQGIWWTAIDEGIRCRSCSGCHTLEASDAGRR